MLAECPQSGALPAIASPLVVIYPASKMCFHPPGE
jgi:hypothetical protein